VSRIFVTAYPRSGLTWTLRLLSDALSSPVQNTPDMEPLYHGDRGGEFTLVKRHSRAREGTTIFVYRDPRDVAVSRMFYYRLPDLTTAIMGMVEGTNGDQFSPDGVAVGTYREFMATWFHTRLATVEIGYHQLHLAPLWALKTMIFAATEIRLPDEKLLAVIERQSFDSYIAANGQEHAMRKGVMGDWQNHFTQDTGKLITEHLGDIMIAQGFIDDLDWWREL